VQCPYFNHALFLPCNIREDTYQDEVRLKTSIVALDKINYAEESKLILKSLANQGIAYVAHRR
jgi:hypothetical protein